GSIGRVPESSASFVMEENRLAVARNEEIGPAVPVIVGHGATEKMSLGLHVRKRAFGGLFESAVPHVAPEVYLVRRDNKHVEVSVAVVVEKGASRADGFQDIERTRRIMA